MKLVYVLILGLTFNLTVLRSSLAQTSSDATLKEKASSVQNAEDQFLLGRAYARGEGVPQSYEKAGEWYLKAANQGNLKAMNNLGILFLEGQGVVRNEAEGLSWIKRAAMAGDPRSMFLYGKFLCEGQGISKDSTGGVLWMTKASEAGNNAATRRLAQDMILGDDGMKADPNKALPLLEKLSSAGDGWACGVLGGYYYGGNFVTQNISKAKQLLLIGATSGDARSLQYYGELLSETNPSMAYPYLKLASELNPTPINDKALQNCTHSLNPEEISLGNTKVEEIRSKFPPK